MTNNNIEELFDMQASQYDFPYHYIPDGTPLCYEDLIQMRGLGWGAEYLSVLDKVASIASEKSVENILDAGCGDGRLVGRLRKLGFQNEYHGVDLVKSAINFAKAFNPKENFECNSLENISDLFDCVTLIEVLEHIPDEEVPKFMKIICEKLKSNGVLILTVPSDVRPVNKKHFRHYDKDLVINTLEDCGLKIENIEGIYKEDWLVRLLLKINSNSLYTISNRHIQAFISKRIHSRQSSLNESSSTHWCAVGKKI